MAAHDRLYPSLRLSSSAWSWPASMMPRRISWVRMNMLCSAVARRPWRKRLAQRRQVFGEARQHLQDRIAVGQKNVAPEFRDSWRRCG